MNTRSTEREIEAFCLARTDSIRRAIAIIDRNSCGIALVVDEARKLLGTVTDGDIRRAMLANIEMSAAVGALLTGKTDPAYQKPVTALLGTPAEALLQIMRDSSIRQVPLLDSLDRVAGLVTLDDLLPHAPLLLQAVVMAGGFGQRLRPLTDDLPKPMLPLGGRPLMERTIEQLQQAGIRRVNITTHYKPEKIVEHFGDGSMFGVELTYVNEDMPLGTGGALGLMPVPSEPMLVINGDILTQIDFRAMLEYHQQYQAQATMAVRRYEVQVPYGVVECEGSRVRGLSEKPQLAFFVNAGIYLLDPAAYQFMPNGKAFNMTDLIQWLLNAGKTVVSFPIREYWLDIGRHSDYVQAQSDVEMGKISI